jgi:hypothetical protein
MGKSYKPEIFLRMFKKRWDADTGAVSDPYVDSLEVRQEYEEYQRRHGLQIKNTNPPAFIKDFLRHRRRANASWPKEILEAGYTARQAVGGGRIFEFVKMIEGQTEPFPSTAPEPPADIIPYQLSSVSMPLASRRLGRSDEPSLIQVSVRLHVVETYFALFSTRKATIRQVDHLQNALKLRRTEIDALFLGIEETGPGEFQEFMVTCEAKRLGEDIISEQVLQQARAVFSLGNVTQPFVVPIALKSVGPSRIHIVEYAEVRREDANDIDALTITNHAVFELVPPVPGIGGREPARRGAKKSRAKSKKRRPGESAT